MTDVKELEKKKTKAFFIRGVETEVIEDIKILSIKTEVPIAKTLRNLVAFYRQHNREMLTAIGIPPRE